MLLFLVVVSSVLFIKGENIASVNSLKLFFIHNKTYGLWSSILVLVIMKQEMAECWNPFTVVKGVILLSDTPQSRNVSAGTLVEFTCATPETGLAAFAMSTDVILGNTMSNDVMLPNGDRQLTLSFIAPSKHQLITISCVAARINTMGMVEVNQSTAILMIQGKNHLPVI